MPQKSKVYQSYRWLYRHYITLKMGEQEIADLAGTDKSTINRWLFKHGIKTK